MSHYLDLVIYDGEPQIRFRCTATYDAECRTRPADWRDRESWTAEESTIPGFPCWAHEWVDSVGMEGVFGKDQTLATAHISVVYAEGIEVSLVPEHTPLFEAEKAVNLTPETVVALALSGGGRAYNTHDIRVTAVVAALRDAGMLAESEWQYGLQDSDGHVSFKNLNDLKKLKERAELTGEAVVRRRPATKWEEIK